MREYIFRAENGSLKWLQLDFLTAIEEGYELHELLIHEEIPDSVNSHIYENISEVLDDLQQQILPRQVVYYYPDNSDGKAEVRTRFFEKLVKKLKLKSEIITHDTKINNLTETYTITSIFKSPNNEKEEDALIKRLNKRFIETFA